MLYLPIGRKSSRYAPTSSVGTVRLKPVSTFLAVTVTPGRAPPLESVMVPTMEAEVTCAPAAGGSASASRMAKSGMSNVVFLITTHPSHEICLDARQYTHHGGLSRPARGRPVAPTNELK